jgi:hypothetical protein
MAESNVLDDMMAAVAELRADRFLDEVRVGSLENFRKALAGHVVLVKTEDSFGELSGIRVVEDGNLGPTRMQFRDQHGLPMTTREVLGFGESEQDKPQAAANSTVAT